MTLFQLPPLRFQLPRARSPLAGMGVFAAVLPLVLGACNDNSGTVFVPSNVKTMTEFRPPVAGTASKAGCAGTLSGADPLTPYQWYLANTGSGASLAFASGTATANQDINFGLTTKTGCGVKVAVVDEGLEIDHEDLSPNTVPRSSVDFTSTPYSTDPTNPATDGDHGTMVAGIIAMRAGNGLGGRGVAGEASLVGYNFIRSQTLEAELISLGGAPYTADTSVFNQSYGSSAQSGPYALNAAEIAQYLHGVTNLRGGKGAIYVKAGGNGYSGYSGWTCPSVTGLSCENASMDALNTLPYQIVVAAVNAEGKSSSYSTAGSALWVSAPGGETGGNTATIVANYPLKVYMPAMVTTDQSGCDMGHAVSTFNGQTTINPFDYANPPHALNPACNYTSTMNGTSSAAPVTSGVAALLLQANPALTWRDVKHILAKTATNDLSLQGAAMLHAGTPILVNAVSYTAEPAWGPNAAGYRFHNWYGFGRVDVTAALALAATHPANSWGALTDTGYLPGTAPGAITDNNAAGVSGTKVVSSPPAFIEAVVLRVSLTHARGSDLSIELTSPGTTRSVVLNAGNGWTGSLTLSNTDLLTNMFYGETANGMWTLKVVDTVAGSTGTLSAWSIRFLGH